MNTAITTRNLTRSFGDITAVDHLDLNIPEGALFGLIGPNGAGKTTTLRMLAGLLEPSSGEIRIHQLPVRRYWDELRWQIGYMPDFFGVYDELLVWEYLDFYARCYRLSVESRRRIITELLELVDLSEKRNTYVNTLSRGMRQRLCLAHTLVHDPQVLLLDEPASGLDPRARVEMRELLRELRDMGKTIILSSHILSELAELCDLVGIMEKGRLVASAPLDDIRRRIHPERHLQIKLLTDPQRAIGMISELSGVKELSSEDNRIDILFSGDESDAADLLDTLVKRGIRISAFEEVRSDLEEIYLQLTTGEVS